MELFGKNSGGPLSIVLSLGTLPSLFLGPFTGVLADRFDRRKIMMIMDITRGSLAIFLSYLVSINQAPLWVLLVITMLLSVCGSMYFPASGALFPNLVHKSTLLKANSVASFLGTFAALIGQPISGQMYSIVNAKGAFFLNGLTYFFAAFMVFFVISPQVIKRIGLTPKKYFNDLTEGFKFIWKTKALVAMLLFGGAVNLFFWPIQNIIQPLIGKQILAFEPSQYTFFTMFFPAGMLLSTMLLQFLPSPKKKHKFMLWSMFSQSIGLIILAIPILPLFMQFRGETSSFLYIYSTITLFRGLAFGFTNVPMQVVYQTLTPDEYRGRVFALQGTFFQSLIPLGMGIAGILINYFNEYTISIFSGVCMGIICLLMFKVKSIKEI
jgi:MFS family permease